MGLFKSRNTHRAGSRSFAAFKKIWIGTPFSECLSNGTEFWEREYQDTLKMCGSSEPMDILNNVIDGTMRRIVEDGQEMSQSAVDGSSLPEETAQEFAGNFVTLGALSNVVFAYVPAVASALNLNSDQVCYDAVELIRQSVKNRKDEINSNYAEAANICLGAFLEELFDSK